MSGQFIRHLNMCFKVFEFFKKVRKRSSIEFKKKYIYRKQINPTNHRRTFYSFKIMTINHLFTIGSKTFQKRRQLFKNVVLSSDCCSQF